MINNYHKPNILIKNNVKILTVDINSRQPEITQQNLSEELSKVIDKFEPKENKSKHKYEYRLIKHNKEKKFLEYIYSKIPFFVLNQTHYNNIKNTEEKITESGKYINTSTTSGELGELILFILLESKGIQQLYNKIRNKSSPNMNVNGYDAVHIEIKDGDVIFYFGEAKLQKNFHRAVQNSISSIEKGVKDETYEFRMIQNHIDCARFNSVMDKIEEYVNPYIENSVPENNTYPIFIGYDWETIKQLESEKRLDEIKTKYKEFIDKNTDLIHEKISRSTLKDLSTLFLIIPFKDVENLRNTFNTMIDDAR